MKIGEADIIMYDTLGVMLKQARTNNGMDLRSLARAIDYSLEYIKDVEGDRATPSITFLKRYAEAIGMQLGFRLLPLSEQQ